MEVKTNELLAKYDSLKAEYDSLEENQLNLFGELANICNVDWKDGHSIGFAAEIEKDRLESERYKSYIMNKISIFDFIYNKYSSIGATIKCNLNRKDSILSAIDTSIAKIDSILSKFSEIVWYDYPEFDALYNKQQDYIHMRNKLSEVRGHFDSLFSKIQNIENEISSKIRELEDFKSSGYSFKILENQGLIESATLDENMFALDYKKIELYKNEERNINKKLYSLMNGMRSSYSSPNVNLYSTKLGELKNIINALYNKRNAYLRTLDLIPPIYGINIQKTIENFKEV